MDDQVKAWVWSEYKGEIPQAASTQDIPSSRPNKINEFQLSLGLNGRTKRGVLLAAALLTGMLFPSIAILLLLLSCVLIASGQAQEQVEDFLKGLPLGEHMVCAINAVDRLLA